MSSGFTTYTNAPCEPLNTAEVGTMVACLDIDEQLGVHELIRK